MGIYVLLAEYFIIMVFIIHKPDTVSIKIYFVSCYIHACMYIFTQKHLF
jgi:hypothetical protein